jgi:anti-anti-sigma regulatory factor
LSVLLRTQKKLSEKGGELTLRNLSSHISDVFRFAGFDLIFKIE